MNVMIVCGGTGGHLFPGMALGEELLNRRNQVMLVVSEKEIDRTALKQASGFLIQSLPSVGWQGLRPDRVVRFFAGMISALRKSKQIIRDFSPNIIVGMGGFSSVAPLIIAKMKGIPSCIHESNRIAGKANRLSARIANAVALGVDEAKDQFPHSQAVWTGTPLRRSVRDSVDRSESLQKLSLDANRFTVLVMGGSQGARGLNRLAAETAKGLHREPIQWIHLTGKEDEQEVKKGYDQAGVRASVHAFYHDMQKLYGISDLAIARSGAASLAELIHWNIPALLIPYPHAADQHQTANARVLVDAGAARMWEERDCDPGQLISTITAEMADRSRLENMKQALQSLRQDQAHEKLADLVEKTAKGEKIHGREM